VIDRLASNSEQNRNVQVLVVEDETIIARDIQDCLEHLGYVVPAIVATGIEAVNKATELHPDLILMDIRLKGDIDGIQAAEQIWTRLRIPIIYATGFSDRDTLERAKLTRPFGYILKPIEERELYAAIETALYQYRVTQALHQREQWLATVLRDIGDGVIVVDRHNRISLMNLVAEALTGWRQEEAIGKELLEVFNVVHEQTFAPIENPIVDVLERGTIVYLPENTILISKDNTTIPIADTATPIRDETGAIVGVAIVFRDVTKRRIIEERDLALQKAQQLEVQMAELQKLNQLKDDFLNTVSHELRTPLANMKMAIQMLEIILNQEEALSDTIDRLESRTVYYLEILREQCNQELSLVNDLLDLQRLNADTYSLTVSSIRLQDWIPHIAEHFQERIYSNQQVLQMTLPPELPPLISDIAGLTRILSELLNNACKYTPSGGTISITAQVLDCNEPLLNYLLSNSSEHLSSAPTTLQIRICNSGIELAPEELERVFDQFYRIPNTDIRNQGGTGLGLALARRLAHYLCGTIRAESGSGQTCFVVELPVRLPDRSLD